MLQYFHEWDNVNGSTKQSTFFNKLNLFLEYCYLFGLVVVYIYYAIVHACVFHENLEFLPLMAVSVYCAVGVIYCWLKFLMYSFF